MNTQVLSEPSYSNGIYKAKPAVQSTSSGKFQGVVIIGAVNDNEEYMRHTTRDVFDTYQDALEEARKYAHELLRTMPVA